MEDDAKLRWSIELHSDMLSSSWKADSNRSANLSFSTGVMAAGVNKAP